MVRVKLKQVARDVHGKVWSCLDSAKLLRIIAISALV